MKTAKTILGVLSIFSAIMLWSTKGEWLGSLSAFALSDNVHWYRCMHLCIISFFLINVSNKWYEFLIPIGMSSVFIFDMYHFPTIHNVSTAISLLLACFGIIYANKGFWRNVMMFLSGSAILIFCLGYFSNTVHLLLAEIIAIVCLMNGKLLEILIIKDSEK